VHSGRTRSEKAHGATQRQQILMVKILFQITFLKKSLVGQNFNFFHLFQVQIEKLVINSLFCLLLKLSKSSQKILFFCNLTGLSFILLLLKYLNFIFQ